MCLAVSYADLWIYAACVAIGATGGPKVPFTPGRADKECPILGAGDAQGRSPPRRGHEQARHDRGRLRLLFQPHGFNDQEIVALSGARGLGTCHTAHSGFSRSALGTTASSVDHQDHPQGEPRAGPL